MGSEATKSAGVRVESTTDWVPKMLQKGTGPMDRDHRYYFHDNFLFFYQKIAIFKGKIDPFSKKIIFLNAFIKPESEICLKLK